jgi:FtsP/CotA-like multicopper oxidase with cupredoxin domain
MSQRTKVVGARTPIIWLLIAISLIVIAALAVGGLVIYPQFQTQQALEQHYKAGVAFQNVSDWAAAEGEYKQVIVLDANYKDVQARLAEVKTKLAGSAATATAVAIAQAGQAQANAQATATAQAQATTLALEAHYQKGLGYMNMGQWANAKTELEQVFSVNPNYKDVQIKLAEVEAKLAKLLPTATPTPKVTSTPTATATPDSSFFDNFDGDAEGWVPAMGTWSVIEGQYVCVGNNDARSFAGKEYWTDYAVSADIKPISGNIDVGVIGRLQDAEHFYLAQLRAGKAWIWRRSNDWQELVSVPYAATNGTWYKVRLEFRGTRLNMYIGDALVVSAEDAIFLRGKIGLRCAAGSQTYFDNVKVTLLSNR